MAKEVGELNKMDLEPHFTCRIVENNAEKFLRSHLFRPLALRQDHQIYIMFADNPESFLLLEI